MDISALLLLILALQVVSLAVISLAVIRRGVHKKDQMHEMQVALLKDSHSNQQNLTAFIEKQVRRIGEGDSARLEDIARTVNEMQKSLLRDSQENHLRLKESLDMSLRMIREGNEKKLGEIQEDMNKKLDMSLNERLDSSFQLIGEQLNALHKNIGELNALSSGVSDLRRTLSNIKTRGTWGEVQLEGILENIMVPSQYEKNVATKKGSDDRVEFAVKIPDKENNGDYILLPIDSKFPADIYGHIADAADACDMIKMKEAQKELESRIKQEAKKICDKYICPPDTTDFAVMFLPTEGLYSEVLRIPELAEFCQAQYRIVIAGPMTVTALLNSLSIGFRYLTVNKNSHEILKILSAVKTQYDKFGELITKTQKKLDEAQKAADDMQARSDLIRKKLAKVESAPLDDAERLLEIGKFS